jgi:hypothetical protein
MNTPKPTAKLALSGSLKHNPKQYANRTLEPQPKLGLGEPPAEFDAVHRRMWREFSRTMPEGVFGISDKYMAELACRLIVRMRNDTITMQQMAQLTTVLSKLGMSPTDRTRVQVDPSVAKKAAQASPFATFASKPPQPELLTGTLN